MSTRPFSLSSQLVDAEAHVTTDGHVTVIPNDVVGGSMNETKQRNIFGQSSTNSSQPTITETKTNVPPDSRRIDACVISIADMYNTIRQMNDEIATTKQGVKEVHRAQLCMFVYAFGIATLITIALFIYK
jgi:hypothetical protein